MIIGTAGHIDHGKTTLVKALTGVDADRLPEEKARGITLDLGYAYRALPDGNVVGFIDVPGHEKLVHNMLAGATGIDFALLVVAADDGPMPQTREHLAILDLLGVNRGAIAITKIDRVEAVRVGEVAAQVRTMLQGSALHDAAIIPISAHTGDGIDVLNSLLLSASVIPSTVAGERGFRLAIDRAFTVMGAGTIVTGTVFAGAVSVGDTLTLSPPNIEVRVRSIHAQNRVASRAQIGERCGINIAGAALEKDHIKRGDWLLAPPLHAPTRALDVRLHVLAGAARPLAHLTTLHFHLGAAAALGRVAVLEGPAIEPGQCALARVTLDQPIGALAGDRFIVRDASASRTLGGGTVLDPFPPPRRRRAPERLRTLNCQLEGSAGDKLTCMLAGAVNGVDVRRFTLAWNVRADQLELDPRLTHRVVTREADVAFSLPRWTELRELVTRKLREFHVAAGAELGPDLDRLRRIAAPQLAASVFAALIDELLAENALARSGPWLHLPEHRIELSAAERSLAQQISPLLARTRFDPPWVRAIASELTLDENRVRALMLRMTRVGELHQVVRDLFYSTEAVAELARLAADIETRDGEVKAAAFRDAAGIGRKRAVQLLEFFDRIGFTRRAGDAHRRRASSLLEISR